MQRRGLYTIFRNCSDLYFDRINDNLGGFEMINGNLYIYDLTIYDLRLKYVLSNNRSSTGRFMIA